jgi:hypothetical protein
MRCEVYGEYEPRVAKNFFFVVWRYVTGPGEFAVFFVEEGAVAPVTSLWRFL